MDRPSQKKLGKHLHRYSDRCSICQTLYSYAGLTVPVVFTCIGLDVAGRLQSTSECCNEKLETVFSIGLAGDEGFIASNPGLIRYHPWYGSVQLTGNKEGADL